MFPGVVEQVAVQVVSLHALVEESYASPVVWLLLEFEGPAVLHEFTELNWVASAEFFERRFNFLLFDVVVLFVFASAWESLPW